MALAKKMRGCAVMLLSTVAVFLVLAALTEGALRLVYRGTAIDPGSGKQWLALYDGTPVKLLDPQPFVTNADGFLVANPLQPRTNIEGYRTPDFDEPANGRPTVLFLGDSFTWGETARPLNRAFVDLVRERGYKTINLGISAIGPVQYAAQAERFVPQLKPDAVCVMFYGWNDFLSEPRIRPGLQRAYMTNVGMLFATTEDGGQLSFDEAVARRARGFAWWMTPGVAAALGKTAIARAAAHWNVAASQRTHDEASALENVRRIREVTEANGAKFMLFLLPVRESFAGNDRTQDALSNTFAEFTPLAPEPFAEDFYEPLPGEHFNNAGHARMAEYVAGQLAAAGFAAKADVPAWPSDPLDADPAIAEFTAALGLTPEQEATVRSLIDHMNDDIVTVLFRIPISGGASPGIQLSRLRKEQGATLGLFSEAFRPYILDHTPDPAYKSYAEIIDGTLTATYRQIGAGLTREQLRIFKSIAPERLTEIATGHDPLGKLMRRR